MEAFEYFYVANGNVIWMKKIKLTVEKVDGKGNKYYLNNLPIVLNKYVNGHLITLREIPLGNVIHEIRSHYKKIIKRQEDILKSCKNEYTAVKEITQIKRW